MRKKRNYWLWLCFAVSLLDFAVLFFVKRTMAWSEAVMSAAQMVTLDADYGGILKDIAPQWLFIIFSILAIATPALWGGVVLNIFFGFFDSARYRLGRRQKPCYFFSELHENSLELAKSLSLKNKGNCQKMNIQNL